MTKPDDILDGVLGPRERELMEWLWSRPAPATAGQVRQGLQPSVDLAPTTVHTLLDRLVTKGFLAREEGDPYIRFKPARDRGSVIRTLSDEVIGGLVALSRSTTITSLVDVLSDADPTALDELQARIEERRAALRSEHTESS